MESKRSSRMIAAFALVFACALFAAGASQSEVPKKLTFPPIEIKSPEVQTISFANGLHGYLIEDHEIPVINIVIRYRATFAAEDKTGLNELAGWAIRNGGSSAYPTDALNDELEFVGATVESNCGNYVGQISANFLVKDADRVLAMLADVIKNPAFQADAIDIKKKQMIEDIRRKADEPEDLGRREFARVIYRGHPASREATVESVSNLTLDDLTAFWARYVRPNNAVIGISGDITRDEAIARLEATLGDWRPGGEPPVVPEMNFETVPTVNYIYKDLNQAYIWVGHMAMNEANPDLPVANIMNWILGGGSFTSWIIKRVRSDEGLAYDAGSRFGTSPWGYGLFSAACQTRSDAAMRALGIMIEQIEKMKNEGPSETEVATARDALVNTQVFEYESCDRLVDRLVWYDIVGRPLDTLDRELKAYQAATLADVNRVAAQYLHPEALTILVVGNQELFDRPLSDFGKVNVIEIKEEVSQQ